jgi:drug/metabolite transporter (DMT)-like permease
LPDNPTDLKSRTLALAQDDSAQVRRSVLPPQRHDLEDRRLPQIDPHHWRGYFLIAAATLGWGAAATAGKAVFNGRLFAGGAQISPLVLTQTRTTFTVLLLFLFLLARYGGQFFRISRRDLLWCSLAGTLGTAGSNFFYYYAVQKSTVAIAITLQYTAPIWVVLFMVLGRGEKLTARRVSSVLLALAGTALTLGLFPHGLGTASELALIGPLAALAASFSFAFYNIVATGLVHRNHPLKVMMYSLLSSAVLWSILNPPWRLPAQHFSSGQWGFLFVFACLSMLLPYICFFHGLKYLDPTRAVIASCLEPVFAILFAAVLVHEGVSGWQVLGVAAVLVATVTAQA